MKKSSIITRASEHICQNKVNGKCGKCCKNLAPGGKICSANWKEEIYLEEFILPFGGKLNADNRWIKLSKIIPRDTMED